MYNKQQFIDFSMSFELASEWFRTSVAIYTNNLHLSHERRKTQKIDVGPVFTFLNQNNKVEIKLNMCTS